MFNGLFNQWGQQMQPLMQPAIWIGALSFVVAIVLLSVMKFVGSGRRQRGLERFGRGMLFEMLSVIGAAAWFVAFIAVGYVCLGWYFVSV